MDRPTPYNHSHQLNNRSPTDGQWRTEPQRRHARSHPDDDYVFPRRVEFVGPPPYPPPPPGHLRDPRLNRGMPSPSSHSGCSPQPHNQVQSTTFSPLRINPVSSRRHNVSMILGEHSYFRKCEPGDIPNSKSCPTAATQQESQVDSVDLPRHMLSPVPRVYSVIMNKPASPLNSRTEVLEKTCHDSAESQGTCSLPTSKELKDVLALVASASAESKSVSKGEVSIKQDSKNMILPGVVEIKQDSKSTTSPVKVVPKKEPVNAEETPLSCSDEESSQLKDEELDTDQTPHSDEVSDSGYPGSPAISLSGFDLDLDIEPVSSDSSDEEEQASEVDLQSEDELLQVAPTSFVSNKKSRKADIAQEEVEAEPSNISQSNSRVLRNRILPCSTTSTTHSTRRQPVAVLDNKVPSLRLPLSRDGILHSKIEDSLKQPRTRRSRRLATSQDATAENSKEKADEAASPKVSMPIDSTESNEGTSGATEDRSLRTNMEVKETMGKELTKEQRMLLNLVHARAAKASKEKRRARRFFSGNRKRTQTVSL